MKRYFAVSTADQLPQVFRAISSEIESTDTDGDDIPDIIDAIDLYPLTPVGVEPEPSVLEIGRNITLGAVFGETGIIGGRMNWMVGDSIASSPYYLVGWLSFSLVPVAGAVVDARDAVQAFINGDELGAALNAAGVFSGLGDAVKVSGAVGTFVVKYPGKISDVGTPLPGSRSAHEQPHPVRWVRGGGSVECRRGSTGE